jgi:hypothetical protein
MAPPEEKIVILEKYFGTLTTIAREGRGRAVARVSALRCSYISHYNLMR